MCLFTVQRPNGDRLTAVFPWRSSFTMNRTMPMNVLRGRSLHYSHIIPNTQRRIYKAKPNICGPCPLREQCTTSKQGRTVSHPVVKPLLDRIMAERLPTLFRKLIRKRQVWIEPKFGELKQWHSGRQFRLRTILKVNIEALLRAAGQNIKQLLKCNPQQNPDPIQPLTAPTLFSLTFCNMLSRYCMKSTNHTTHLYPWPNIL